MSNFLLFIFNNKINYKSCYYFTFQTNVGFYIERSLREIKFDKFNITIHEVTNKNFGWIPHLCQVFYILRKRRYKIHIIKEIYKITRTLVIISCTYANIPTLHFDRYSTIATIGLKIMMPAIDTWQNFYCKNSTSIKIKPIKISKTPHQPNKFLWQDHNYDTFNT